MILFVKNIEIEGPETLGSFFAKHGFKTSIIDLSLGESLPADLRGCEAVICLGGPMNVYEEDKYPYLKEENIFIQNVIEKQIPYLGICLGAQLLAKAAGACVVRSPKEEIGFDFVQLTQEGREDPLFQGLPKKIRVFQWHGDMCEIPSKGVLLSNSANCPHQAFRVGNNAYGIQFHIEITDRSIEEWSDRYFINDLKECHRRKNEMLDVYSKIKDQFRSTGETLFQNFLNIIRQSNAEYAEK